MDQNPTLTEQASETTPIIAAAVVDAHRVVTAAPESHHLDREEMIRKLRSDLKNAEKELDAFSHTVSQDLRGFLRGISVSVHEVLTNHENVLEPSSKGELVKIGDTVKRMGLMIDGMLRLSALTRAEIKIEEIDLTYLVEQIAAETCERHPGKDIEIKVQQGLIALGDERLVTAALDTLLDNACKFASMADHPVIEFGMTPVNRKKAYHLKDNGPGFPPQQAHRIFEPAEKIGQQQSSGMGLTSVKRIIERHGGKVWAQSQPGRGATFNFTLGETYTEGED